MRKNKKICLTYIICAQMNNILLFLNNAFDSPLILKLILFYKFISSKSF
jgi:hypothetical protein